MGRLEYRTFGFLPDGREASLYTLTSTTGLEATITNYGAAVVSLTVSDRDRKKVDVVLGYDALSGYVEDNWYVREVQMSRTSFLKS